MLRLFGVCECVRSVATWTTASFAWSIEIKERENVRKTSGKWSDSTSNNETHELTRTKVREQEHWVFQCNSTHDMFSDDNTKMDRRTYHLLSSYSSSSSPALVTSPVFVQWKKMSNNTCEMQCRKLQIVSTKYYYSNSISVSCSFIFGSVYLL